jgi:hypothetical protein
MRGIKLITDHMVYNPAYNQIFKTKKTQERKNDAKKEIPPIIFREETFLLVKPECANASFASTGKVLVFL